MQRDDSGRDDSGRADQEPGFVHPDPVMDAALDWLFTLQSDPGDAGLRAAFEDWRRAAPRHAEAFALVAETWDRPELDLVARDIAARAAPANDRALHRAPPRTRRGRRVWRGLAVAAAIALVVGVLQSPGLMTRWRADYMTATGARQDIALPDGSRMVLNTDSAASIDFEGGRRSVRLLRGEAFFDVAPDMTRPFVVAATFMNVEVTGTAFSVRSDDARDTVVLARGHVEVTGRGARDGAVFLDPGERITATAEKLSPPQTVDAGRLTSWTEGRLVFADQPLGEMLTEIGRYYGHRIILVNGGIGGTRVTGTYRLDDPERVIRSLATAAGGSVTRLPGGILIVR